MSWTALESHFCFHFDYDYEDNSICQKILDDLMIKPQPRGQLILF